MEAVSVSATKPLVTFAIATYNQQGLIEEAIRSAFQQSYVPLEILISDDCSTDKTYDVIQEIVKSYNGPHTITLNQNPENLGIGRHWDQIGRAAKGELIIHAAGDDISLPFRTEILVKVWQENIGNLMLISSDGMKMTFDGKLLEPHIGTRSREKRNFQSKIRRSNLVDRI